MYLVATIQPARLTRNTSQDATIMDIFNKINSTIFEKNPNVTSASLLNEVSYNLTDLFVVNARCQFDGQVVDGKCSIKDFDEIITKYGKCFTFNGASVADDKFVQHYPGYGYGLRLTGNIHQSEYSGKMFCTS